MSTLSYETLLSQWFTTVASATRQTPESHIRTEASGKELLQQETWRIKYHRTRKRLQSSATLSKLSLYVQTGLWQTVHICSMSSIKILKWDMRGSNCHQSLICSSEVLWFRDVYIRHSMHLVIQITFIYIPCSCGHIQTTSFGRYESICIYTVIFCKKISIVKTGAGWRNRSGGSIWIFYLSKSRNIIV